MSGVLTEELCREAWSITYRAFEAADTNGVADKFAGSIVVLVPGNGDVLFHQVVNPAHPTADRYTIYAKAKASLAWRLRMSTFDVRQRAPHLMVEGDIKWGGAVYQDGLAVGFSGVQEPFDEAVAKTMLSWTVALCRNEVTKSGGIMESDSAFVVATPWTF